MSRTNAEEVSAAKLKKASLDKYYIPPSNDNIIMSEQPATLEDIEPSVQKKVRLKSSLAIKRVIAMPIVER